jgi:hypothetical protein
MEIRGAKVEFRSLVQRLLVYLDHEAVEVRHQTLHTLSNLLGIDNHLFYFLFLISSRYRTR